MQNNREIGNLGEDIATQFLVAKGYKIIDRNFQKRQGELDIIAKDTKDTLVFIEVKAKASSAVGAPSSKVDKAKQQQIGKLAEIYLAEKSYYDVPCRFDVISIIGPRGNAPIIKHYENAFMLTY